MVHVAAPPGVSHKNISKDFICMNEEMLTTERLLVFEAGNFNA